MSEKENAKKVEKLTTEKTTETRFYFKDNQKTENEDFKISKRVYGVKNLQSYVKEIEEIKILKNHKVEEHYFRNGNEINLNDLISGSGITAMLGLLSKEVKNADIERVYEIATGGLIVSASFVYNIELY